MVYLTYKVKQILFCILGHNLVAALGMHSVKIKSTTTNLALLGVCCHVFKYFDIFVLTYSYKV